MCQYASIIACDQRALKSTRGIGLRVEEGSSGADDKSKSVPTIHLNVQAAYLYNREGKLALNKLLPTSQLTRQSSGRRRVQSAIHIDAGENLGPAIWRE